MLFRFAPVGLVASVACAACAGASPQTNEAIAVATAAGASQLVKTAAEEEWKHSPPRRQYCGDLSQYECYAGPVPDTGERDVHPMSLGEARQYTLLYLNGVRSLNGIGPLALDESLNDFAQEGSVQLSHDNRPHQHIADQGGRCLGCGENQGNLAGMPPAPVQKQIDEAISTMMAEGPGGGHHDNLLSPEWTKVGVGIVNPGGRMYFTTDFQR